MILKNSGYRIAPHALLGHGTLIFHELISYTDHPGPMYKENHAELKSRIKATFELIGQSTHITMTYDQFSDNNPMQDEAKQGYLILSNLKYWIETGQLMDLEN